MAEINVIAYIYTLKILVVAFAKPLCIFIGHTIQLSLIPFDVFRIFILIVISFWLKIIRRYEISCFNISVVILFEYVLVIGNSFFRHGIVPPK